jgi:hypothetical protein
MIDMAAATLPGVPHMPAEAVASKPSSKLAVLVSFTVLLRTELH